MRLEDLSNKWGTISFSFTQNAFNMENGYIFRPAITPSSAISTVIISGSFFAYIKMVTVAIKKKTANKRLFSKIEVKIIATEIMPTAQNQSGDRSFGIYSGVFQEIRTFCMK